MKNLLLILLLTTSLISEATDYYIAASGSDLNPGTSAAPFKTIAAANAKAISPDDKVFFNRGDVFYGQLNITHSGMLGHPIVFGAFGGGAKPIISGFTTVTSWTNLGGNVWESTSRVSSLATLNMVTVLGAPVERGRYPNYQTTNGGWAKIGSHTSQSITSSTTLPADFTGGEVRIRLNDWVIDSVTALQSSNTLSLVRAPISTPVNGWGFLITNHPNTLDQFGEWYYNPSTGKIRYYTTSANPTVDYPIQVATVSDVVTINNVNYITLQDLQIQGANRNGIVAYQSAGLKIQRCDITACGNDGIGGPGGSLPSAGHVSGMIVDNCTVSYTGNFGMDFRTADAGNTVTNNTLTQIAMWPSMGGTGSLARFGIVFNSSSGQLVTGNSLDYIGYIAVRVLANSTTVQYNQARHYCMVLHDGGAFYTAHSGGGTTTGLRFLNNFADGTGSGAPGGTTAALSKVSGVYLDDNSNGVEAAGNIAINNGKAGVYVHNAYNINVHDNTAYNNGQAQLEVVHDNPKWPHLTGLSFKHNIGFAKLASQWVAWFYDRADSIGYFGSIDSNNYLRPILEGTTIQAKTYVYLSNQSTKNLTLATWQAYKGYDLHSYASPKFIATTDSLLLLYNVTMSATTTALAQSYMDARGNVYSGTITLQPFTAVVLIADGNATGTVVTPPAPTDTTAIPPPQPVPPPEPAYPPVANTSPQGQVRWFKH